MKVFLLSITAVFLLSAAVVGQPSSRLKEPPPKLSEEDQVRLVVFTELLMPFRKRSPNEVEGQLSTFFFGIEGETDCSEDLMRALGKGPVPFKKASRAFALESTGNLISSDTVWDSETKRPGLLFRIYKLSRKSEDEFLVHAGWYEGNMSAFGCGYVIRRKESVWKIVETTSCEIS